VAGLHFGGDDRKSYMVVGAAVDSTYKADKFNTPGTFTYLIVLVSSFYLLSSFYHLFIIFLSPV
jgi:hypothetical protein